MASRLVTRVTHNLLLALCLITCVNTAAHAYSKNRVSIDFRNVPDNLEQAFRHRISQVERTIAAELNSPPTNFNLETKIFATITLDGRLINAELEETSGLPDFDNAALRAVCNTQAFGQYPNLGPRILLAEITVTQTAVQEGEIRHDRYATEMPPTSRQRHREAPPSDWIEDNELGTITEAYDTRPWNYSDHSIHHTLAKAPEPEQNRAQLNEISGLLHGFRPLSAFQLKFIPEEQKTAYLEKLAAWSQLSLAEKFKLW